MIYFVPDHGVSGPKITISEVCIDSAIVDAFEMAEEIYKNEVVYFLNNFPCFHDTATKEQRAIYVLARALQTYAQAASSGVNHAKGHVGRHRK